MVEEKLKEVGYPVDFKKISLSKKYQIALSCLVLLSILDVFGLEESGGFDVGYKAPTYTKLFTSSIKHLASPKTARRAASIIWPQNFSIGALTYIEFDEEKQYATLCLYEFKKIHPIFYIFLTGFLTKVYEIVTKSESVKVKQTKSLFSEDPHDEFKITW
jgi:hypothetical protein